MKMAQKSEYRISGKIVLAAAVIFMSMPVDVFAQSNPPEAGKVRFFSVLDDVPVMAGLTEREDETILFDNPEGRIADLRADMSVPVQAVIDYYRAVLPQFGWEPGEKPTSYIKGDERLDLLFIPDNGILMLRIGVTPR